MEVTKLNTVPAKLMTRRKSVDHLQPPELWLRAESMSEEGKAAYDQLKGLRSHVLNSGDLNDEAFQKCLDGIKTKDDAVLIIERFFDVELERDWTLERVIKGDIPREKKMKLTTNSEPFLRLLLKSIADSFSIYSQSLSEAESRESAPITRTGSAMQTPRAGSGNNSNRSSPMHTPRQMPAESGGKPEEFLYAFQVKEVYNRANHEHHIWLMENRAYKILEAFRGNSSSEKNLYEVASLAYIKNDDIQQLIVKALSSAVLASISHKGAKHERAALLDLAFIKAYAISLKVARPQNIKPDHFMPILHKLLTGVRQDNDDRILNATMMRMVVDALRDAGVKGLLMTSWETMHQVVNSAHEALVQEEEESSQKDANQEEGAVEENVFGVIYAINQLMISFQEYNQKYETWLQTLQWIFGVQMPITTVNIIDMHFDMLKKRKRGFRNPDIQTTIRNPMSLLDGAETGKEGDTLDGLQNGTSTPTGQASHSVPPDTSPEDSEPPPLLVPPPPEGGPYPTLEDVKEEMYLIGSGEEGIPNLGQVLEANSILELILSVLDQFGTLEGHEYIKQRTLEHLFLASLVHGNVLELFTFIMQRSGNKRPSFLMDLINVAYSIMRQANIASEIIEPFLKVMRRLEDYVNDNTLYYTIWGEVMDSIIRDGGTTVYNYLCTNLGYEYSKPFKNKPTLAFGYRLCDLARLRDPMDVSSDFFPHMSSDDCPPVGYGPLNVRIVQLKEWRAYDPIWISEKGSYIEPVAFSERDCLRHPIMKLYGQFLDSPADEYLMVQGASGYGKSLSSRCLDSKLWGEFQETGLIPIWINTLAIGYKEDILDLMSAFFNRPLEEIINQGDINAVLIIDGLEQIQPERAKGYVAQLSEAKCKKVIYCRDSDVMRVRLNLQRSNTNVIHMLPFTTNQIEEYVAHFTLFNQCSWKLDSFRRFTMHNSTIPQLISNPQILATIVHNFDMFREAWKDKPYVQRTDVMEVMLNDCLTKYERNMGYVSKEMGMENIRKDLWERYLDNVGFEMGCATTVSLEWGQQSNKWEKFIFDCEIESSKCDYAMHQCRALIPWIRSGTKNKCLFLKNSMMASYLIARAGVARMEAEQFEWLDEVHLKDMSLETELLAELAMNIPDIVEGLQGMVRRTVKAKSIHYRNGGANAASLLVAMKIPFAEYDGDECAIIGANLKGAIITNSQWKEAFFNDCNLMYSCLSGSDFSLADLTNVQIQRPPFVESPEQAVRGLFNVNEAYYSLTGEHNLCFHSADCAKTYRVGDSDVFSDGIINILSLAEPDRLLVCHRGAPNLQIVDINTWKTVVTMGGHRNVLVGAKLDFEKKYLGSCAEGEFRVWSMETYECLHSIEVEDCYTIFGIGCSNTGGWVLVYTTTSGNLRIADEESPDGRKTLQGDTDSIDTVTTIEISADGKMFATGYANGDIYLWDTNSGARLSMLKYHFWKVNILVFSPYGELASAGYDGSVVLWDTRTKTARLKMESHSQWLTCLAYSHEGGQLVTAGRDHYIFFWDTVYGDLLHKIKLHNDVCTCLSWSPNDKLVLTSTEKKKITLYRVADGAMMGTYRFHLATVTAVQWPKDSNTDCASVGEDGVVNFWKVAEFQIAGKKDQHRYEITHRKMVGQICHTWDVSANGMVAFVRTDESVVEVWDILQERFLVKLEAHTDWVCAVQFSHDCKLLATTAGDLSLRIYRKSDWQCTCVMENVHVGWAFSLSFSPDDSMIISAGGDRLIRAWSVDGKSLGSLEGHEDTVLSTCFAERDYFLISGSRDQTARLWNFEEKREVRVFSGHTGDVVKVGFLRHANIVFTGSHDKTVRLWDSLTGLPLRQLGSDQMSVDTSLLTPDGQFAIWFDEEYRYHHYGLCADVTKPRPHQGMVCSLSFSTNCEMLMSVCTDGDMCFWDMKRHSLIAAVRVKNPMVGQFLPKSDDFITVSNRMVHQKWDIKTGQLLSTLEPDVIDHITVTTITPGGSMLAGGTLKGTVYLVPVNTPTAMKVLNGHKEEILFLRFHQTGQYLASISQSEIYIWNVLQATPKKVVNLSELGFTVRCLDFSPSMNNRVAVGDSFFNVTVIEYPEMEVVRTHVGHTSEVNCVHFSPDLLHLISGSSDLTVRGFSTQSRECLFLIDGFANSVMTLATGLSGHGYNLACGGSDSSVRSFYVNKNRCTMQWRADTMSELTDVNLFESIINLETAMIFDHQGALWQTAEERAEWMKRRLDPEYGLEFLPALGRGESSRNVFSAISEGESADMSEEEVTTSLHREAVKFKSMD